MDCFVFKELGVPPESKKGEDLLLQYARTFATPALGLWFLFDRFGWGPGGFSSDLVGLPPGDIFKEANKVRKDTTYATGKAIPKFFAFSVGDASGYP
jgi:hypothetical protein